jgi:8-oxo-dGTP pyrophosphatase MutT (NUDIX family)
MLSRRAARDMAPDKMALLGTLFKQWLDEEAQEPEHAGDQLPSAAGTMMMTKDGKALFVRRAAGRDHAGHWSIPAGMTEDDEMPWQTAMRETNEEVGDCGMEPRGMRLMDHRLMDNVGFTTYGYPVDSEFEPTLDEEHDAYMWSPIDNAPHPLHPGLEATLKDYTQDPLTDKGSKIMEAMQKQYGPEKGEQVFYASKNKGNIKGVDGQDRMVNVKLGGDDLGEVPLEERFSLTPDGNKVIDKHSGMSYNIDDIGRILFSPDSMDATAGVNKPNEVNVNKPTVETANWRPPKFEGVRQMQNDGGGGYSWRVPRYGRDAGTSEGAKKAAQTRAAHGGHGTPEFHDQMAATHLQRARNATSHSEAAKHMNLYTMHAKNARHIQGRRTAGDDGMWRAPSYGRDAGTSEGAKKAAETRKAHHSAHHEELTSAGFEHKESNPSSSTYEKSSTRR